MNGPTIEYSLCIFNFDRTELLQRLALPCPAPIFPAGHYMTINDDSYNVFTVGTSITTSDDGTFICYVTEVCVKPCR